MKGVNVVVQYIIVYSALCTVHVTLCVINAPESS